MLHVYSATPTYRDGFFGIRLRPDLPQEVFYEHTTACDAFTTGEGDIKYEVSRYGQTTVNHEIQFMRIKLKNDQANIFMS